MAYFGVIFFANMGGGGGQNYSQKHPAQKVGTRTRAVSTQGPRQVCLSLRLECHKWGLKRRGFKEIRGYLRKKAFSSDILGFSRCSWHPPEKGEKGRKRAKKADFGRFPGRAARHPLNPHLLHPHLRQPN